jgi:predicted TIM-barrel fold metal-dependent hydrolase
MPMHTKIAEAVDRVGPERVMYGSDAPFHHPAVEILRVRVSGIDDAELEEVLHRSGRKLFLGEEGTRTEEVTSLGATG